MSPIELIRGNSDNTYDAITILYGHGLSNVISNLETYYSYHAQKRLSKLISLGTIDCLGSTLDTSPIIKKYGIPLRHSKSFRKLSMDKQFQLLGDEGILQGFDPQYTNSYYLSNHDKKYAPVHIIGNNLINFYKNLKNIEHTFIFLNNKWYIIDGLVNNHFNLIDMNSYYFNHIMN